MQLHWRRRLARTAPQMRKIIVSGMVVKQGLVQEAEEDAARNAMGWGQAGGGRLAVG